MAGAIDPKDIFFVEADELLSALEEGLRAIQTCSVADATSNGVRSKSPKQASTAKPARSYGLRGALRRSVVRASSLLSRDWQVGCMQVVST